MYEKMKFSGQSVFFGDPVSLDEKKYDNLLALRDVIGALFDSGRAIDAPKQFSEV